jgi:hypothetical protein
MLTIYKEMPEEKKESDEKYLLSIYRISPEVLIKNALYVDSTLLSYKDIIDRVPLDKELNEETFLSILKGLVNDILIINDLNRLFAIPKQKFLSAISLIINNVKSELINLTILSTISEIKKIYKSLLKIGYIEEYILFLPKIIFEGYVKPLFLYLKNIEVESEEKKDKIIKLLNFLKEKYPELTKLEELKKEHFSKLKIEIKERCSLCKQPKPLSYVHVLNENMLICNDCFEKLQ